MNASTRLTARDTEGQLLQMTTTIDGVFRLEVGDRLRYLGNSTACVLTGPSAGLVVRMMLGTPVTPISES